jgi:hypothetical protein
MESKWYVEVAAIIAVAAVSVSVINITRTDGAVLATAIGAIVFIATRAYYKFK